MRIYQIFPVAKWRECAFCNWEVARLFVIAESEGEARAFLAEFGSGACAECIVDAIRQHYKLQPSGR